MASWVADALFEGKVLAARFSGAVPLDAPAEKITNVNLAKADEILSTARSTNTKLDKGLLSKYGQKALRLSESGIASSSDSAWQSVNALATYQSFLNSEYVPGLGRLTPTPTPETNTG